MTAPTVPVTVTLDKIGGTPVAGVTVRARLDRNEVYLGIVVSEQVEAVTDGSGVAVLELFPNAPAPTGLGTQGSTYRISAAIPGGRSVNVEARVPNSACRLENILVGDSIGTLSDAELALLQAQAAVPQATAKAAEAAASAAAADASKTAAAGSATAAAASATAAAGSATGAATSATTASSAADAASTYSAAAAVSASSASVSALAAAGNAADGRGVTVADYPALRAYTGPAASIFVLASGIAGTFTRDDSDTTSADNAGTIIVASNGKRWKRVFDGPVQAQWFGTTHAALTAAIAAAQGASRVVECDATTYTLGTSTLNIPAGVALRGIGRGSIVNTTPTTGTILNYTGTGTAVSINGTLAGLERISVVGTISAAVGVLLNGDGVNIESWYMRQVTIYGFTGGVGLKLQGINSGGVLYGSVYDLRIRHAKTGIYITDVGGGAGFVNTNQFYGGAINGGGFDYCIRADGGNDNRFYGMSVEPPSSTFGHIVLEADASLSFKGRVEAVSQAVATPTVVVASTASLEFEGLYAGTFIQNQSGQRSSIAIAGSKATALLGAAKNLLKNGAFAGIDTAGLTIPEWTISVTGAAPTITVQAPELFTNAYVLRVDVPAGSLVQFTPGSTPHDNGLICFGTWMKTAAANQGLVTIQAPSVVSSSWHPGDSFWHQVGLAMTNATGTPISRIRLDNTGGGSTATFYLTAPFHSTQGTPLPEPAPITANGGYLSGTIESGACTVTLPGGDNMFYTTATLELTVPKWGNTAHITGTARTITRLNNLAANRWAKGSQLRLIFDIGGVVVTDGGPGFIDLTAAFTSAAPATVSGRSWLLLESVGDGTWYELDRRP